MAKTYNGWTNYETWNAKLWLDEGGFSVEDFLREQHIDIADKDRTYAAFDNAKYELSQFLRDEFEEFAPELSPGPYADLLTAAISDINWYEIAEAYLSDCEDDDTI